MGLKVKVDEFLQTVTVMRKTAIDEAVLNKEGGKI
jgi:hypothetical protein